MSTGWIIFLIIVVLAVIILAARSGVDLSDIFDDVDFS